MFSLDNSLYCPSSSIPNVANAYTTTVNTTIYSTTTYSCSLGYKKRTMNSAPVANCASAHTTAKRLAIHSHFWQLYLYAAFVI